MKNKLTLKLYQFRFLLLIQISIFLLPSCENNKNKLLIVNNNLVSDHSGNQSTIIEKLSRKTLDLQIEEMFWKNRLEMAKKKSNSLLIDLVENQVILEINGVPLRECYILNYNLSKTFAGKKEKLLKIGWLDKPFILKEEWATIPKAPITLRETPKNRDEALEMLTTTIPIDSSEVCALFQFNGNLSVIIRKNRDNYSINWIGLLSNNNSFYCDDYWEQERINPILNSLPERQNYWIEIELENKDARAVFRALPENAQLTIRL